MKTAVCFVALTTLVVHGSALAAPPTSAGQRFVKGLARLMPVSTAKMLTQRGYLQNRGFGYSPTKSYHAVAYNKKLETQCELMRATPAGIVITGIQAGDRWSRRKEQKTVPTSKANPIARSWSFFSKVITPTCAVFGGVPGMVLNGVTNSCSAGGKFMQHVAASKLEAMAAQGLITN